MKPRCDICGKETDELYVVASAVVPVSYAYCADCLGNGLEPYNALVVSAACVGHFPEDFNPDYAEYYHRQLQMHGISIEKFNEDINELSKQIW